MNSYRKTAIIVGVLFITATAASLVGSVFLGSTLAASNYLTSVSANENQVIIAMIFELIAAVSALGTAVMLFPIFKKIIESLAQGYVVLRLIENIFYIVGALSLPII
jgi:Na+/melibiose symporter-like transporter